MNGAPTPMNPVSELFGLLCLRHQSHKPDNKVHLSHPEGKIQKRAVNTEKQTLDQYCSAWYLKITTLKKLGFLQIRNMF